MLIVFDRSTGEVLDNTGQSAWLNADLPADVVERIVTANLRDVARSQVDYIHVADPDLQRQLLTHQHTVDPASGQVVVGDPHPDPEPDDTPTLDDELAAAIEAASTLDELKAALLGAAPEATSRVAAQAAERPTP